MQLHRMGWMVADEPDEHGEIVTGVAARQFTSEPAAKAFWERLEAEIRTGEISIFRMTTLERDSHVVVVLGSPADVEKHAAILASAGSPYRFPEAELQALALRRLRAVARDQSRGATESVIRRGTRRADVLWPDGRVSPLRRQQG